MTDGLTRVSSTPPQDVTGLIQAQFVVPTWAKKTTILFSGVSSVSGGGLLVQVGNDLTNYETNGYLGSTSLNLNGSLPSVAQSVSYGFSITTSMAPATTVHGTFSLYKMGAGLRYAASSLLAPSDVAATYSFAGSKVAAQYDVTKIKATFATSDVFDAGFISAIFEG